MIYIVTGKIKSGKTSKMKEMYESDHLGDGFILNRVLKDNKFYGYEISQLSKGNHIPFSVMEMHYQYEGYYDKLIKGFYYNSNVYKDVLIEVKHLIRNKVEPIYLDGLGELELLKKGFDEVFLTLLKSHLDLVISVPDSMVRKFIIHYRLNDYKIISCKKNK